VCRHLVAGANLCQFARQFLFQAAWAGDEEALP